MTWTTHKPSGRDPLSELPTVITSRKSDFSSAISAHFYWQDTSGTSAGEPRFSQNTISPGSARMVVGTESQVSAKHDGALMMTTDTYRFAALTSAGSVFLGGKRAVVAYSASSGTASEAWVIESGITSERAGGAAVYNQAFSSAYSAAPYVFAQAGWSTLTDGYNVAVTAINVSGFSFQIGRFGTASPNSALVMWAAYGRKAIT